MGQPPAASEKPSNDGFGWNSKSILIIILSSLFLVSLTAAVTWKLTVIHLTEPTSMKDTPHKLAIEDDVTAHDLRLPNSIEPLNYTLTVKTYLPGYGYTVEKEKNLTFDGQVEIMMRVKKDVRKITLNTYQLTYKEDKCTLFEVLNDKQQPITFKLDKNEKLQKLFINLDREVNKDAILILKLLYSGPLRTDLTGFYQTNYMEGNNTQKIAAVTQLQADSARRLVPCFDEPEFKANWTVSVIHPKGTKAISNGIEIETNDLDQFMSTKFETTPRMSSYLLAIFVSEFEYLEGKTNSGIRFRVWSRPEAKELTKYALEAGIKCIEGYEKMFNIPFPLKKQDMVSLPDFSQGAMENWGLITYRENYLLYDPTIYKLDQKKSVALVIAHELAHQWFGNLVTLKWWDDLWLNEGFATLVEYTGTDIISDGNFKMDQSFVTEALRPALEADSKISSTHPLSFRIDKTNELEEAFDSISYDKGAAVLAMVRNVLSEDHFISGVQDYLNTFKYSNADSNDLLMSMVNTTNGELLGPDDTKLNISHFALQWTKQLGYPIITVSRINDTHVSLKQSHFKKLKGSQPKEKYSKPEYGFKWDVPIWYQKLNNSSNDYSVELDWLSRDADYLTIKSDTAIIVNAESKGYYRVIYDTNGYEQIIKQLKQNYSLIPTKSRVRLIDDSFSAAAAGLIDYQQPIKLILSFIDKETEYLPLSTALIEFRRILAYYGTDPERESIEKKILSLIETIPAKMTTDEILSGGDNEKLYFEILKSTQLKVNECLLGNPDCIKEMLDLFNKKFMSKCKKSDGTLIMASKCSEIGPAFRSISYCLGVEHGDSTTFKEMFNFFKMETNPVERMNLLRALTCRKNIKDLKKLLLNAMKPNGSDIRLQDVSALFIGISSNDISSDFMLNFLLTRWDKLLERLDAEAPTIRKCILCLSSGINSEPSLQLLTNFVSSTPSTKKYGIFDEVIENAKHRIEWRKKNMKIISELFQNYS